MKIHIIGIGGIGVSSLAQYYISKGHQVSGSDLVSSEVTDFLKTKGAVVFIGNFAKNIAENNDLVIYSLAVSQNNPELKRAGELSIKLQSYPEALAELTKQYFTIAVSGAHGKSTTTSMLGLILIKAGLDPTVIVGTKLKEFGSSNFRAGKSEFLVIEACEYDGAFLHYLPQIIVITNIDKEHLDYFKTFSNVKKAFRKFILKLPANGFLVANKDDKNLFQITRGNFKTEFFSIKQKNAKKLKKVLKIPGEHNVYNALAAFGAAKILGISEGVVLKSLSEYSGSWRRFEILKTEPYVLISDYGHHPNEISATLKAAREKYPKKKIWCVFQPHQYQRTHYLFKNFVDIFRQSKADKIIITDIYDVAGREDKKISKKINSENLVKKINRKNVFYVSDKKLTGFLKSNIKRGEVLIIMGAGDIYKLADRF